MNIKKNTHIKSKIRLTAKAGVSIGLLLGFAVMLIAAVTTPASLYGAPKKRKLKPEYEEFYHYARYLFTKNERKIFSNLPDDQSRDAFIRYFWEIRDPNPMTEENEFKVEIERRYEYSSKYLKEGPIPGWKTDRGRIYILLGPPTNRYEDTIGTSFGRVIWWYYEESDIYARFVDAKGTGIFRMDLRNVSLRLLDELERRKYYIVNKEEKDNFLTEIMDFKLRYDKSKKEIQIDVNTKHLSYEKDKNSDNMIAKIKVNLVIYTQKNNFTKHADLKTITMSQEQLLTKKSKVTVTIPIELPKGKLKIDAIVTDFLGDAVQRKFVKIKN